MKKFQDITFGFKKLRQVFLLHRQYWQADYVDAVSDQKLKKTQTKCRLSDPSLATEASGQSVFSGLFWLSVSVLPMSRGGHTSSYTAAWRQTHGSSSSPTKNSNTEFTEYRIWHSLTAKQNSVFTWRKYWHCHTAKAVWACHGQRKLWNCAPSKSDSSSKVLTVKLLNFFHPIICFLVRYFVIPELFVYRRHQVEL